MMPHLCGKIPSQRYQSESALHQNWMRDYDPTTGRYFQADPLGLVDGASVYNYALQNPGRYIDPTGEFGIPGALAGAIVGGVAGYLNTGCWEGAVIGIIGGGAAGALGGALTPTGSAAVGSTVTALVLITTNGLCCEEGEETVPTLVLVQMPRFWFTVIGGGVGSGVGSALGGGISRSAGNKVFGSGPMFSGERLRNTVESLISEGITGAGGAAGELGGNGLSGLFD